MSSKMLLSDLPLELMIHIFAFITPVDLVRARMTCKSMETASYDRSLWYKIFSDACTRHDVAEGTYDTPTMTREELEHASLNPYRFARRAFRSRSDIKPTSTQFLREPADLGFSEANIILMPGGRFLFIAHRDESISLWDLKTLSMQSGATTKLQPLASIHRDQYEELQGCSIDLMQARTGSDGKTFRVMVWVDVALGRRIHAYEIVVVDHCPNFRLLRILSSRFSIPCLDAFDGDRGILEMETFDGNTAVWDLLADSTISWPSERLGSMLDYSPGHTHEIASTILLGNRFARFKSINEIAVYDLPIQPRGTDTHSDLVPQRIATLGATPTPLGYLPGSRVSYWVSQPQLSEQSLEPSIVLEFTEHAATGTITLRMFQMDLNSPSPHLNELSSLTLSGIGFLQAISNLPRLYLIGDAFAIHWIEDSARLDSVAYHSNMLPFKFYVTKPSGSLEKGNAKGNEVVVAEMTLEALDRSGISGRKVQFCPLSGRLVVQDEDGEIIVRDYYGAQ